ncbi:cytochrome oxidase small assembly protein [Pararobbsia silviterrae]|nr:cytochrome oxidase small assembly protein [Pararobbsia silviterrae]
MTGQRHKPLPHDNAGRDARIKRNNRWLGLVLFVIAAVFFAGAIIQQWRSH